MPLHRKALSRCVPSPKTMQKKELISLLDNNLKPFGFKKNADTWKMGSEELTKYVKLQKSSFGNLFYINYGYDIKGLDYDGTSMHVFRGLITSVDNGVQLLDFDNTLDAEYRSTQIASKLQALLSTEISKINTVGELKEELQNKEHLNDVPVKVKEFLGLPVD